MNVLRSELIKLRTIRAPFVLAFFALAFPLTITLLTMALIKPYDISRDTLPEVITNTAMVSAVLIGIIAVLAITNDYNYNTIRPTFAATPSRPKVMVAKLLATVIWAVAIIVVVIGVGWFGGAALADNENVKVSLDDLPGTKPALIGLVPLVIGYCLIGLGLGALVRSQAGAISLLAIFPLVAEGIIWGLLRLVKLRTIANHLPFRSGMAMASVDPHDNLEISRISGGLVFGTFAVVIFVLGILAVDKRDA